MPLNEDSVVVSQPMGTANKNVRMLLGYSYINGVLTATDNQIACLVDDDGHALGVILDVRWQRNMLAELQAIRKMAEEFFGQRTGLPDQYEFIPG